MLACGGGVLNIGKMQDALFLHDTRVSARSLLAKQTTFCQKAALFLPHLARLALGELGLDGLQRGLGVTQQHDGVVLEEDRVLGARVAGAL